MANSKRKCPNCQEYNRPEEGIVVKNRLYCNIECAVSYGRRNAPKAKAKRDKDERRALRERKEELRPRSWYLKEAQKWFNKYIRLRDADSECISCGREYITGNGGKFSMFDAGHYRSVGANPELRFEELNCHSQCVRCNRELSGNVANYRIRLIKKIGDKNLSWLEGPHNPKKYTIDDLKEIIAKYKQKCKEFA